MNLRILKTLSEAVKEGVFLEVVVFNFKQFCKCVIRVNNITTSNQHEALWESVEDFEPTVKVFLTIFPAYKCLLPQSLKLDG